MGCTLAALTMDKEDEACAHRAEGNVGPLSYHQIKDGFEPQGDAESWIEKFNAEHYKTFESGEADWNQFMHLATARASLSPSRRLCLPPPCVSLALSEPLTVTCGPSFVLSYSQCT